MNMKTPGGEYYPTASNTKEIAMTQNITKAFGVMSGCQNWYIFNNIKPAMMYMKVVSN